MDFQDLGLSEAALAAVKQLGYSTPTPIQAQAIPVALAGNDIVAAAKTGTGKTAAFALPIICKTKPLHRPMLPSSLVISPTRELAQQTGKVLSALGRGTRHRTMVAVGGVKYGPQIKQLRSGVDALVATPGRLLDLIDRRVVDLSEVQILVLDEADRMMDMGFWPSMQKIISLTPDTRQTLLFSATIDDNVMRKMSSHMKNPDCISIAHKGETPEKVEQCVMPVSQSGKPDLLNALLTEGDGQVIVFARTKHRSDSCARMLCSSGHNAEAIHSGLSQSQRHRALDNFTKGHTRILVATDVLARGIDVSGVEHVINYDLPDCPEDYVHRIGRTGRAGQTGDAISFVNAETRSNLRDIEKLLGQKIPTRQMEGLTEELPERPARGADGGNRKTGAHNHNRGYGRRPGQGSGKPGGSDRSRQGGSSRNGASSSAQASTRNSGTERSESQNRSDGAKRPGCSSRAERTNPNGNASRPNNSNRGGGSSRQGDRNHSNSSRNGQQRQVREGR